MARGLSSVLGLRGVAAMAAVVALLAVAAAPRCAAQGTTTSGCTASIISLAPCLSFTAGNASAPTASCCSALAAVVRDAPRCLCAVLGGGAASLGVTINTTRALELPGLCKVQTPPASQCNATVGAPAASPPAAAAPGAGSASPSTPAATVQAPTATGAGSKVTPATGGASSDAAGGITAAVCVSLVVAVASLMAF